MITKLGNWKKFGLASASLMMMIGFTGCHGGGGGYVAAPAWYDVYGYYCGSSPGPGCNFYGDGYQIIAQEDPYYYSNYYSYGTWSYYDSYGYPGLYIGYAWQSANGIIYDDYGYALNEEKGDTSSKDLIADMSERENNVVSVVGENFAKKYALNAETGISIARTLNDYATLNKKQKRARTDKDIADFSQRLYGVTADKAQKALDDAKKGSAEGLEALNGEVAVHWGTNPETSKVILKSWYKNQLSEYNVK